MKARTIGAATAVLALGLIGVGTTSAFADTGTEATPSPSTPTTAVTTPPSSTNDQTGSGTPTPTSTPASPSSAGSGDESSQPTGTPATGSTSSSTAPSSGSTSTPPSSAPSAPASPPQSGPSHGTPPKPDPKVTETLYWLLPDGGTADNVTWPQTTVDPTACVPFGTTPGTIQVDVVTGTQKQIDKVTADGILDQGEDSSIIVSWTFALQPVCAQPAQPADVVTTVTTHNLVCSEDFYYTTVATTTTSYVWDESSLAWVLGTPVTVTDTTKVAATAEQCPPVIVPPTKPVPPVGPRVPVSPTKPVSVPSHPTHTLTAAVPSAQPTASGLAYTGTDTARLHGEAIGGGALIVSGIIATVVASIRRRRTL